MIENRSVPPKTVLPHISYQDVIEAIAWLTTTFGFREHYRYGDPVNGAQIYLDNAWIMLEKAPDSSASSSQRGRGTQCLTVFIGTEEKSFTPRIPIPRAASVGSGRSVTPRET